jgi:hypothetical protein
LRTRPARRVTSLVTGQGIGARKRDGSCDMSRPLLVEIDTFSSSGTLSY